MYNKKDPVKKKINWVSIGWRTKKTNTSIYSQVPIKHLSPMIKFRKKNRNTPPSFIYFWKNSDPHTISDIKEVTKRNSKTMHWSKREIFSALNWEKMAGRWWKLHHTKLGFYLSKTYQGRVHRANKSMGSRRIVIMFEMRMFYRPKPTNDSECSMFV